MSLDPLALRCVCVGIPLASLTVYPSLAAAQSGTACGTVCGMCVPYIEMLLLSPSSYE